MTTIYRSREADQELMEDPTEVQLKVISCRDLNTFNFFQKLSTYVVVSLVVVHDDDNKKKMKEKSLKSQKTPVDGDGDVNPEWNHEIVFDLREEELCLSRSTSTTLFLKFDIRCKGVVFGNKTVGEVRVPLEDMVDEFNGAIRFVSYQVRTLDGNPNGVLNFSYKINGYGGLKKIKKTKSGLNSVPSERVFYPSVEFDFSNPSPAEISPPSHDQKSYYYPTSEVIEDMNLQSSLSSIAPKGYYYSPPPPPPGRNGYFYN